MDVQKKQKCMTIIVGVGAYIASLICGAVLGTVVLCAGTAYIYNNTRRFWIYTIITLILNVIASIFAAISLTHDLGLMKTELSSEYEEVAMLLIILPLTAILFVLIIIGINMISAARFGLQCLSCYLVKKYIAKKEAAKQSVQITEGEDYEQNIIE